MVVRPMSLHKDMQTLIGSKKFSDIQFRFQVTTAPPLTASSPFRGPCTICSAIKRMGIAVLSCVSVSSGLCDLLLLLALVMAAPLLVLLTLPWLCRLMVGSVFCCCCCGL